MEFLVSRHSLAQAPVPQGDQSVSEEGVTQDEEGSFWNCQMVFGTMLQHQHYPQVGLKEFKGTWQLTHATASNTNKCKVSILNGSGKEESFDWNKWPAILTLQKGISSLNALVNGSEM
jgi:hypothetical protein